MKSISFVSIYPEVISSYLQIGVLKAATRKALLSFHVANPRSFAVDQHGSIDDRPFGGGDGMIMRPEPLESCIKELSVSGNEFIVMPSPIGKPFTQKKAVSLAELGRDIIFVCGRFGGIDQRFTDQYVDEELSLGDYILAGGELAALAMAEAITRTIPGVLGHPDSARLDSFSESMDGCLEAPMYTRPRVFNGQSVPDVLLSGNHDAIEKWRAQASFQRTKVLRPDLLK